MLWGWGDLKANWKTFFLLSSKQDCTPPMGIHCLFWWHMSKKRKGAGRFSTEDIGYGMFDSDQIHSFFHLPAPCSNPTYPIPPSFCPCPALCARNWLHWNWLSDEAVNLASNLLPVCGRGSKMHTLHFNRSLFVAVTHCCKSQHRIGL